MDKYTQGKKEKLLILLQACPPDKLPPCGLYGWLMAFIGATERNRNRYGLQTCREWLETIANF